MEFIDKSKFISYISCPVKFKEIYIEGKKIHTIQMERGSQIHDFIKNFWNVMRMQPDVRNFKIPNFYDDVLSNMAVNFLNFQVARYKFLKDRSRLDLFIPRFYEEKFVNYDLKLKGIVDMITEEIDGNLSLVEIKGFQNYKITDNLKLELDFYNYLLNSLKMKIKYGVIYFPASNNFIKYNLSNDFSFVKNTIEEMRVNINNNTFNHKKGCNCNG